MINRRLLIIGVVIALVFGAAIFYMAFAMGPKAPVIVLAAREDIHAGTRVDRITEESLARIPLSGDSLLLGSYLTDTTWLSIQSAGGVIIRNIYQYEAIPLSSIASGGNPRISEIPELGLTDPNLVVVSLKNAGVPNAIKPGDRVDLVVAVVQRDERYQITAPQAEPEVITEANPDFTPTPTPKYTPTPTVTPTPTIAPEYPLAKVIVQYAEVSAVQREERSSSGGGIELGKITAIDVVIPREAVEFVMMADAAGELGLSLLSPMAEGEMDQAPTLGAHFEDLLDLFKSDRYQLSE
jgi:Flp pilus assembly protein CpaB